MKKLITFFVFIAFIVDASAKLPADSVALENAFVKVMRHSTIGFSEYNKDFGKRIIVALTDTKIISKNGNKSLKRGEVSVFQKGEKYKIAKGDYFEVSLKNNHPTPKGPDSWIEPTKNKIVYNDDEFRIFEESLEPGDTRELHSHAQRVVIRLNEVQLTDPRFKPNGTPGAGIQVPNTVRFAEPATHVVKNLSTIPLFNIVIEFKVPEQTTKPQSRIFSDSVARQLIEIEREKVIERANKLLTEKPITVTASFCSRSAGGKHDFYSEGPYWWPDTENPKGPFIRKDGLRFPERFVHNDDALRYFSWIVGTETSAYILTHDEKYAKEALKHLNAWFVDADTRMNPNMLYAQAIQGICTGRGIGIIDAIPLMDVAQSINALEKTKFISEQEVKPIIEWFKQFVTWLTTHRYGLDEMNAKNNHGSWWHAQLATYARLIDDEKVLELCRNHYEEILLPAQMAENGSFPLEIERTKPYSYSLFNLDALAATAWVLSDNKSKEWDFKLADGRDLNLGLDFMYPFLKDKSIWKYGKDVSHWDEQPDARPFMLFAALAQQDVRWFTLWKQLNEKNNSDESLISLPIKNPLLWVNLDYYNLK